MNNDVKPRFDGKGSEFGKAHRELPTYCGMFDVDRMKASAIVDLELTKQDVCFFEYRTDFKNAKLTVKAMFEIKYKDTSFVREAMIDKIGTSTWAQIELCKMIGCRYFFVIANNGKQPFEFYEYKENGFQLAGTLNYQEEDITKNTLAFWKKLDLLN